MKSILSICCCLLIAAMCSAQETGRNTNPRKGEGDKYVQGYSQPGCTCLAHEQGGKMVLEKDGKMLNGVVTVGPRIKITDGVMNKQGGAERKLVDGNCVSEKGTITLLVK